jgi:hypothetical protein
MDSWDREFLPYSGMFNEFPKLRGKMPVKEINSLAGSGLIQPVWLSIKPPATFIGSSKLL